MLKTYTDGAKTVYAGQITAVEKYASVPGALKIAFGEDSNTTLNPSFCQLHSPQVGHWFVIDQDYNGATIMRDYDFGQMFSEVQS